MTKVESDYWRNQDLARLGLTKEVLEGRIRLKKKINGKKELPVAALNTISLEFFVHRAEELNDVADLTDKLPEQIKKDVKIRLTYDENRVYDAERERRENNLLLAPAAAVSAIILAYPVLGKTLSAISDYFRTNI
ncbi:hypothetical protein JXB27_03865 [Candidatus Woesearchaeota archaeon]|nr:hypothetical protein [Candidatus Woesearchaeota archaeon]